MSLLARFVASHTSLVTLGRRLVRSTARSGHLPTTGESGGKFTPNATKGLSSSLELPIDMAYADMLL